MKKFTILILAAVFLLTAETLFQVKDSQDRVVLDVSTDGLRVYNEGDLLMEISSSDIRAFIEDNPAKGLARSFSVTTSSNVKNETNVLEITTQDSRMREGSLGLRYTGFSPENIFLGLNSGISTVPAPGNNGKRNVFIGNEAGYSNVEGCWNVFIGHMAGNKSNNDFNVFIGFQSGKENVGGRGNTFVGENSGGSNTWGVFNAYFGASAATRNLGNRNAVFGASAGEGNWDANYSRNAIYGYSSGINLATGSDNVLLGYRAGHFLSTGSGNVLIGTDAGYSETGSNKLYIANSSTSTPLIYGDFSASAMTVNGTLTATGNTSVGGTYFRINSNPGSGTPTSYVYQGGMANSTGKDYAFAINDALWVTSNAWIDGTLNSKGIEASVDQKSGLAANFKGDVYVFGTLSKSSDAIKIDHPLDPENKYLSHTGVSSDKMSNIYHGNVELDNEGKATVSIEAWIEFVNKDFRYQLTPIGAPGPNLYIAREISGNSFEIAGGVPGSKVSWQVTGIRNDNYAKSNQFMNETEKKDYEKGFYLHPEAYGLQEERGIEYNHKIRMKEYEIAE